MKNYYQILNVRVTATEAEIKTNYRILAKRYHPDVNPDDATAASKFADINEANAVLSDPKSRAEYDAKLKEASSTRLNQEDIIARQRAQAQAAARQAARQAAYRNGMNVNQNMGSSARRDATIARARAAQAQAQAQAQAKAQAQFQAIRNQAYQSGREHGMAEARRAAESELSRLNTNLRNVLADNKKIKQQLEVEADLKRKLSVAEQDRRELEQELFNRDREFSQASQHIKELETQVAELQEKGGVAKRLKSENAELKEKLLKAQSELKDLEIRKKETELKNEKADIRIEKLEQLAKKLEQDRKQAELKNAAQIQLQQDKRKQMQDEIDVLTHKLAALTAESESLRADNDRWQQYAKSEEFLSNTEVRMQDWAKKVKADKKQAKGTLYGELGLLIWATDEEIEEAYAKLRKRLSSKTEPELVAKLEKIEEAHTILSDPVSRADYNNTLGITEEQVAEERKLIVSNESLMEEYRNRLANKEFWAHFDELTVAALSGDPDSQYKLGEIYYKGEEVDRDTEQAAFWFKEAAKHKHADAMYRLGVCFINGEGVERNDATGHGFIRQAAKLGSKAAKKAEGIK